jgi:hypothetical protein
MISVLPRATLEISQHCEINPVESLVLHISNASEADYEITGVSRSDRPMFAVHLGTNTICDSVEDLRAVLCGVDVRTERTLPEGPIHHVDDSFGDIGHIGRRLGGCIARGFNQLRRGQAVAIHGFGLYRREDGDGTCLSG